MSHTSIERWAPWGLVSRNLRRVGWIAAALAMMAATGCAFDVEAEEEFGTAHDVLVERASDAPSAVDPPEADGEEPDATGSVDVKLGAEMKAHIEEHVEPQPQPWHDDDEEGMDPPSSDNGSMHGD